MIGDIIVLLFGTFFYAIIPFGIIFGIFDLLGKANWNACRFPRTKLHQRFLHINNNFNWPAVFRDDRLAPESYDRWQNELLNKDPKQIRNYYKNLYKETEKNLKLFYEETLRQMISDDCPVANKQKKNTRYFLQKNEKNNIKLNDLIYFVYDDNGNNYPYKWNQTAKTFIPTGNTVPPKKVLQESQARVIINPYTFKNDKYAFFSPQELETSVYNLKKYMQINPETTEEIRKKAQNQISNNLKIYINT